MGFAADSGATAAAFPCVETDRQMLPDFAAAGAGWRGSSFSSNATSLAPSAASCRQLPVQREIQEQRDAGFDGRQVVLVAQPANDDSSSDEDDDAAERAMRAVGRDAPPTCLPPLVFPGNISQRDADGSNGHRRCPSSPIMPLAMEFKDCDNNGNPRAKALRRHVQGARSEAEASLAANAPVEVARGERRSPRCRTTSQSMHDITHVPGISTCKAEALNPQPWEFQRQQQQLQRRESNASSTTSSSSRSRGGANRGDMFESTLESQQRECNTVTATTGPTTISSRRRGGANRNSINRSSSDVMTRLEAHNQLRRRAYLSTRSAAASQSFSAAAAAAAAIVRATATAATAATSETAATAATAASPATSAGIATVATATAAVSPRAPAVLQPAPQFWGSPPTPVLAADAEAAEAAAVSSAARPDAPRGQRVLRKAQSETQRAPLWQRSLSPSPSPPRQGPAPLPLRATRAAAAASARASCNSNRSSCCSCACSSICSGSCSSNRSSSSSSSPNSTRLVRRDASRNPLVLRLPGDVGKSSSINTITTTGAAASRAPRALRKAQSLNQTAWTRNSPSSSPSPSPPRRYLPPLRAERPPRNPSPSPSPSSSACLSPSPTRLRQLPPQNCSPSSQADKRAGERADEEFTEENRGFIFTPSYMYAKPSPQPISLSPRPPPVPSPRGSLPLGQAVNSPRGSLPFGQAVESPRGSLPLGQAVKSPRSSLTFGQSHSYTRGSLTTAVTSPRGSPLMVANALLPPLSPRPSTAPQESPRLQPLPVASPRGSLPLWEAGPVILGQKQRMRGQSFSVSSESRSSGEEILSGAAAAAAAVAAVAREQQQQQAAAAAVAGAGVWGGVGGGGAAAGGGGESAAAAAVAVSRGGRHTRSASAVVQSPTHPLPPLPQSAAATWRSWGRASMSWVGRRSAREGQGQPRREGERGEADLGKVELGKVELRVAEAGQRDELGEVEPGKLWPCREADECQAALTCVDSPESRTQLSPTVGNTAATAGEAFEAPPRSPGNAAATAGMLRLGGTGKVTTGEDGEMRMRGASDLRTEGRSSRRLAPPPPPLPPPPSPCPPPPPLPPPPHLGFSSFRRRASCPSFLFAPPLLRDLLRGCLDNSFKDAPDDYVDEYLEDQEDGPRSGEEEKAKGGDKQEELGGGLEGAKRCGKDGETVRNGDLSFEVPQKSRHGKAAAEEVQHGGLYGETPRGAAAATARRKSGGVVGHGELSFEETPMPMPQKQTVVHGGDLYGEMPVPRGEGKRDGKAGKAAGHRDLYCHGDLYGGPSISQLSSPSSSSSSSVSEGAAVRTEGEAAGKNESGAGRMTDDRAIGRGIGRESGRESDRESGRDVGRSARRSMRGISTVPDSPSSRRRGGAVGSGRQLGYGGAVGSFRDVAVPSGDMWDAVPPHMPFEAIDSVPSDSGYSRRRRASGQFDPSSAGDAGGGSGRWNGSERFSGRGEERGEPEGRQMRQQQQKQQPQQQQQQQKQQQKQQEDNEQQKQKKQQQQHEQQKRQVASPPPLKLAEGGGVQGSVLGRPYVSLQSRFVVGRREIGRGQFGVIYKCVPRGALGGVAFACKTIKKRNIETLPAAEDIRREVEALEKVKGHPGIVELHSVFEDPQAVHLVMQLCRHGDLFDHVKMRTRLPEPTAACILSQLLHALQHCHDLGVIHRDVKPENVLIYARGGGGGDGEKVLVKLGDFGVATRFSPGMPCMDPVGTAMYMAPELLQGRYGPAADVWSAGIVLYVMLSGALPFFATKNRTLVEAIMHGPARMEGPRWEGVSEGAKAVVRRMLEKDPEERATIQQIHEFPWMKKYNI